MKVTSASQYNKVIDENNDFADRTTVELQSPANINKRQNTSSDLPPKLNRLIQLSKYSALNYLADINLSERKTHIPLPILIKSKL